MKLSLGSAQFGLNYGISNKSGKISINNISKILTLAASFGIDTIDTAIAYGESETNLGKVGLKDWKIISKLPDISSTEKPEHWIHLQVRNSLQRLNQNSLYGLLLHNPSQLDHKDGPVIWKTLLNLKEQKLVEKIGISLYSPKDLDKIIHKYDIDLLQLPVNLFDRSLENSIWPKVFKDLNIEIHARSIFLQGLLLMNKQDRPKKFLSWQSEFNKYEQWLIEEKLTPLEACLGYVFSQDYIDKIIVGIDNLSQLNEIIQIYGKKIINPPNFTSSDEGILINPSKWGELYN